MTWQSASGGRARAAEVVCRSGAECSGIHFSFGARTFHNLSARPPARRSPACPRGGAYIAINLSD
jgi:hypothetical protein